jgi:hypothetical protein
LTLATAALIAVSLNANAVFATQKHLRAVTRDFHNLEQSLAAENSTGTADVADPLEMQRAVTSWQRLAASSVAPETILRLVSTALETRPAVELEGLEWQANATTPADIGDDSGEESETVDESAAPLAVATWRVQLRGQIQPFDGNYPLAFAELQAFMNALKADDRVVSVTASKQPLDVNPRSTLTGEYSTSTQAAQAPFVVDVVVRFEHERA